MRLTQRAGRRFKGWLTLSQPVSYWTFWRDLLGLVPILVGLFALLVVGVGTRTAMLSFVPFPFVFAAATAGYAIRELNLRGAFWSALAAFLYAYALAVTDVGLVVLQRPTPILTAVSILTFFALFAGFAAPSLHGGSDEQGFRAAYREHQLADADDDD